MPDIDAHLLTNGGIALILVVWLFLGIGCLSLPIWWRHRDLSGVTKALKEAAAQPSAEARRREAFACLESKSWLKQPAARFRKAWEQSFIRSRDFAACDIRIVDYLPAHQALPKLARNRRLATALPGILVALGILGTFLGLVLSLPAIGDASNGSSALAADPDLDHFQQLVNDVVSGLGLAFRTSIAGITLSVLFIFIDKASIHGLERALDRFSDRVGQFFPCAPEGALERAQYESAEDQKNAMQTMATDIATQIGAQIGTEIGDSVGEQIKPAVQAIEASIQKLIEFSTDGQLEGVRTLADEFVTSMNEAVGQQFQDLRDLLAATVESQKEIDSGLSGFDDLLRSASETQQSLIDKMKEVAQELAPTLDHMTVASSLVKEAAENVLSAGSQLETAAESVATVQERSLDSQRQLMQATTAHTEAMKEARDQLMNSWGLAVQQAEGSVRQIRQATKELSDGLVGQLENALLKVDRELAETIERFSGTLAQVDGAIAELPRSATRLEQSASSMTERTAEIVASLDGLRSIIEGPFVDTASRAVAAGEDFGALVGGSDRLVASLNALASQLDRSFQAVERAGDLVAETQGNGNAPTSEIAALHESLQELRIDFPEDFRESVRDAQRTSERIESSVVQVRDDLRDQLPRLASSIEDALAMQSKKRGFPWRRR